MTLLTVLGQMEILKALVPVRLELNFFNVLSNYLTNRLVIGLQITATCLFLVALSGEVLRVPNLSKQIPWVQTFYERTYALFVVLCLIYENFHCVYLCQALYQVAQQQSRLLRMSPDIWEAQDKAYKRLFGLVSFIFFFDWIAIVLWVISFNQPTFSSETLISGNLGAFHIVFVVLIFKEIRKIKIQKDEMISNSTSKSLNSKV
ncbi:hypothetical protein HDV02_006558 [Globomyces sp. JEL0801]|nr:hypothetical protein HDV02_006558 [Globomyces sp. JEL0801]